MSLVIDKNSYIFVYTPKKISIYHTHIRQKYQERKQMCLAIKFAIVPMKHNNHHYLNKHIYYVQYNLSNFFLVPLKTSRFFLIA